MFREYDNTTFARLKAQHNILVLVGNGFDIAVLEKLRNSDKKDKRRKTTSYKDFFEYVKYFGLANENNRLFSKMEADRRNSKDGWCDFEHIISDLKNNNSISSIRDDVDEFRKWFTLFLYDTVDSDVLLELNNLSQEMEWPKHTLGHFLEDLDNVPLKFKDSFNDKYAGHFHLLNYAFLNLNYTTLLDNYIFLDQTQFEPHPHKGSDTNFLFYVNNDGFMGKFWSYVLCDVLHPHGIQNIPRSILFGIDLEEYDPGRDESKYLVKGYWAQYETRYRSYFETTSLFIIYGMALGETDAWWLDEIYENIKCRDVELIIYRRFREGKTEETVKDDFIKACVRHNDDSEDDKKRVKENIHVVLFQNNDTHFLGLKDWKKEEGTDE